MIILGSTCQTLLICCRDMGAEGVAVDASNGDIAMALAELGFATLETLPERRLKITAKGAAFLKRDAFA